jgi:hypothetical protein
MTDRPLARERLPAGLEASAAAPLLVALGDRDRARATWAAAHGLASLELAGRFPAGRTSMQPGGHGPRILGARIDFAHGS